MSRVLATRSESHVLWNSKLLFQRKKKKKLQRSTVSSDRCGTRLSKEFSDRWNSISSSWGSARGNLRHHILAAEYPTISTMNATTSSYEATKCEPMSFTSMNLSFIPTLLGPTGSGCYRHTNFISHIYFQFLFFSLISLSTSIRLMANLKNLICSEGDLA